MLKVVLHVCIVLLIASLDCCFCTESNCDVPAFLVTYKGPVISCDVGKVDVIESINNPVIAVQSQNNQSECIPIYFLPECHQIMEMFGNKEKRLDFKVQFHKVMEDCQPRLLKIIDKDNGNIAEDVGSLLESRRTDPKPSKLLISDDRFSDDGVHSERLILSGTALHNIGRHLAWVYCHTRLISLCQDMTRRTNCSRFPKMLPKLVVLFSSSSEIESFSAGYIASKSSHPDISYFCEVFNVEYGDEEHQVIVDHPRQLRVLQNLMERGKLTEKQCESERQHFVDYIRDACKKISLLSHHCIVVDAFDSENIFQQIMMQPPPENDFDSSLGHTLTIRDHYVFLVDNLDAKHSGLVGELYSANVLSRQERDTICSELTSFAQNEKLLSMLSRKTKHDFEKFLDAMDKTGQAHVRNHITGQQRQEQPDIASRQEDVNVVHELMQQANSTIATSLQQLKLTQETTGQTAMAAESNCDVDEAFEEDDDDDDLCVDGEAQLRRDDSNLLVEGQSLCPSTDLIIVMENQELDDDSDDDDNESVWCISSSLDVSVRSENCEVLHLNSNMVVASLKQSGLITDRAYNQLTSCDDHRLTRSALSFLWLAVSKSPTCYNSFIEAAQALCSRAMKNSGSMTKLHASYISEQNNRTRKEGKQEKRSNTLAEENCKSLEKANLTDEDKENKSLSLQVEGDGGYGESGEYETSSNLADSDEEKRSIITVNLLFAMIKDLKYLPYDFEVQLRRAVLQRGMDVASMRNETGCSLLHYVLLQNRAQFVQPLFRTGCWKALQHLTVDVDKGGDHAGKTADDICIEMRSRKLQKELDVYSVWEKSLNLIHIEARVGNLAGVRRWLEYSSDLHTELDCMNCSTLYWACIGGNADIVQLLLGLKVDYRTLSTRKESLLHAACMMGHHHLIEMLVKECEPDFSLKDTAKKTPALRVSENGDERSLAKLVECGMPREQLGSILAIAGHYGRVGFLQMVVEKYHVDPQSKDDAGKSALHRASEQGRLEVLRYLFTKNLNFEEVDSRRRNLLHVSADGASSDVVSCLLRELKRRRLNMKKLVNARDKYIGGELCMLIRGKDKGRDSWHYVEVSRSLMDVFMRKTRGGTIDVAKYGTLLFSGWGPDPDDDTAQEIERRFETRRNNNLEDPDATPLHIAAFKDKHDVAEVLLDHGADPNTRDKFGLTPLHVAAMRGNMVLVRRLVEVGATAEALTGLIKTPADVAEDNEHRDVANYLKGVKYLPVAQQFRERVLPNIQKLVSADYVRSLHESGQDVRTHLINALRDLTVDINETLLSLGSGPVLEESSHHA